jgi:hypothetical protein
MGLGDRVDYGCVGLIVDRVDCGRGMRAPTNPLW